MPPTDDQYQRYADQLGEPLSEDLKAFVDALRFGIQAGPLPAQLEHFTLPASRKASQHARHNRYVGHWSLASVAAIVVIVLMTVILVLHTAPSHLGVSSQTATPVATSSQTATPVATSLQTTTPVPSVVGTLPAMPGTTAQARAYYRCVTVDSPTFQSLTNCNQATSAKHISLNASYYGHACINPNVPHIGTLAIIIDAPNPYTIGGAISVYQWDDSPSGSSQPPCWVLGSRATESGQYHAKFVWSPKIISNADPFDPSWQLAQELDFDVP